MRVTIRNRRWNLRFCRLRKNLGECDSPGTKGKEIRISNDIPDECQLLTILLHEGLHASAWHASEQDVDETSVSLATMLWKLGYRRNSTKDEINGTTPNGRGLRAVRKKI